MSSQSDEQYRVLMPPDLYKAIIEGNRDVLIPRLGLQPDESTDVQPDETTDVQVITMEAPQPDELTDVQVTSGGTRNDCWGGLTSFFQNIGRPRPKLAQALVPPLQATMVAPHLGLQRNQQVTIEAAPHSGDTQKLIRTPEGELRSVARFGDTVLHLLVNKRQKRHNELALMVFKKDTSLLKLKNGRSETPLHFAAKAGNTEIIQGLIQIDHVIVKDALAEINDKGENALHIATKQGHLHCVLELLELNKEILYTVNNRKLSPIHIAITKGYTQLAKHFMENYPNHAEFLDSGRNIFHIAAEENQEIIFSEIFSFGNKEMAGRMNNAVDYDGNTPMHIAARKGHTSIVRAIWQAKRRCIGIDAERVLNNKGLTPFEVSLKQLASNKHFDGAKISKYLWTEGHKFTAKWFDDVAGPSIADEWEKIQVIGLGSVLITTVTFAAAFTVPGGYDQEHGTPILGRKYIFRLFVIANSLAFIQGFLSLFALLENAIEGPSRSALAVAIYTFIRAASSMVVAFGLGIYVTLAPVSFPLAIIILVITVFLASPVLFYVLAIGQNLVQFFYDIRFYVMLKPGIWIMYVLSIGIGLGLAFL